MKIFDCFLFFNELELLDLRLMVLDEPVDYFVLVEADTTFTGRPKEFIFDKNRHKFGKYLDKIIHVKVDDVPKKNTDWDIENFQRNCINRGLSGAEDGDLIIISDVDEIPNPERVQEYRDTQVPITFQQYLFYYYVNCLSKDKWNGSIMSPFKQGFIPQVLRSVARHGLNAVVDGGWHYSYLGGSDRIKSKLASLSDAHHRITEVGSDDDIRRKTNGLKDLWDDQLYHQLIDIKECSAPHMAEFIKKYPYVFYAGPLDTI